MHMNDDNNIVHEFKDSDGNALTVEHDCGCVVLEMTNEGGYSVVIVLNAELAERLASALSECNESAADYLEELNDDKDCDSYDD